MNEKYTVNQVLKLCDKFIFFSKEKNEEPIYYKKKDNMIICFNSNFKSYINETDFLTNFFDTTFYIYQEKEKIQEEDIINTQYFRQ